MMWLAWRQYRRQVLFTGVGLALLAAFVVPTGLAMRSDYADKGIAACLDRLRSGAPPEGCDNVLHQFNDRHETWLYAAILFLALPLLVGLFWGAPLVAREVEQGTHRFVWTQGITRRRWAAVKLGLVGAVVLVVSIGYGMGVWWWLTPLNNAGEQGRLSPFFFDMQGVAPIGYTLFAVALGIAAGTVWPRMLPAMAVSLAGFVGVRVALGVLARPRYEATVTRKIPVESASAVEPTGSEGGWLVSSGVHNPDGRLIASDARVVCPPGAAGPGGQRCGADIGLEPGGYNLVTYHPADRFWPFQWIETGIVVALAALLIYVAVRRIRRIA